MFVKRLFRVLSIMAGLLLTAGCEDRECVRGHHQPMVVNNVVTLIWICDEYGAAASVDD